MIKKIFFYVLIFTLGSCGYEPMYSKKDVLSKDIQSFKVEGDRSLNKKIISSLRLKNNGDTAGYKLIINSNKKLESASKDVSGNTSVYKTKVTVKITLINNNKILKEKIFSSEFTYNNIENKFDLSQYQKDIETNLINEIIEEIYIFLAL